MSDQAPAGSMRGRVTETTRYLCAAAYLDPRFAEDVVARVLEEEHRAVAPSYGVDLVPVIRHCLAARRRRLLRDSVLASLLLLVLPLLVAAGGSLPSATQRVLLLAWGVVFAASCLDRYEVLAARLLRDRFDPDSAPAPPSARQSRLIDQLQQNQHGNVTVYSGFSPFVGCGLDDGGWSFATDMQKGKEHLQETLKPIPFEVEELYDRVTGALRELHIDRLHLENRLFVRGQDIRDQPWILPDQFARPLPRVDPALVQRFLHASTEKVRHYLTIQVIEWQGELILSIFLRFTQVGGNLFCEASYFLLPPLRQKYYTVDELRPVPDLRVAMKLVARAAATAPFLLLLAPLSVARRLLSRWTAWLKRRSMRRRIRSNPTFDYGAATSVRQSGMSENYRHYFQKLDREMYAKLIEQQILGSIIDFLDERNIDTSDLRERQTTILNNGVILSGGSIQAESFAVGSGARARAGQALRNAVSPAPKGPVNPSRTQQREAR